MGVEVSGVSALILAVFVCRVNVSFRPSSLAYLVARCVKSV